MSVYYKRKFLLLKGHYTCILKLAHTILKQTCPVNQKTSRWTSWLLTPGIHKWQSLYSFPCLQILSCATCIIDKLHHLWIPMEYFTSHLLSENEIIWGSWFKAIENFKIWNACTIILYLCMRFCFSKFRVIHVYISVWYTLYFYP